ncbi:NAD-P-binding protein [Trametes elegans]|nr:NAD-P-binding protein [Trametes elegans]
MLASLISLFRLAITLVAVLFPRKPTWTADHLPDLSDKVALVTGGNTGIGRETVKRLLLKNAKVYLAARSQEKAERAIRELREETGKDAAFLKLDLSDLKSVKKAAEELKDHESQLDMLILNAGVLYPPPSQPLTAQQYDMTFGTNVIGHFLLYRLLSPVVAASGRASDPARVVWLSSMANFFVRGLTYEAYEQGPAQQKADPFDLYGQTKLAAVMLSAALARRSEREHAPVVSVSADPGNIKSEIYREDSPFYFKLWERIMSFSVEFGALSSLYAGAAPEAVSLNGKFLQPWAREGKPNPVALDVQAQEKLWSWVEEQVKAYV